MSNLTVKFLNKEYIMPSDVVTYIGLVDFTNKIIESLLLSFKNQIWPNIENLESDNFMLGDIDKQVSKFISKLLDNDVYDRTANDYLKDNKGYKLFFDTKDKVLKQIISIRKEKLEVYRSGVQDAVYKKDSSVTGLDFGIISSSFVNHMIYAYMDASKQTKQEQEALKVYNREIAELDKVVASYDQQEKSYIFDNVIPAMNTVFTYFAYELLDKYVSDLIRVGKFDAAALGFINLERSNDLLKNLNLSNNKKEIIEKAFVSCPFNIDVYMQAMKYDLLDYESFLAANSFKQGKKILEFLKNSIGLAVYPQFTQPNIQSVTLLSCYTNKSIEEILFRHTASYSNAVINEYAKIIKALNEPEICRAFLRQCNEDDIFVKEVTSKRLANSLVKKIVPNDIWDSLVKQCGHIELFDKIVCFLPNKNNINSKQDLDNYLINTLSSAIEIVREDIAATIQSERSIHEAERQKNELEKKKKHNQKMAVGYVIIAVIIIAFFFPAIIENIKSSQKENYIESKIENVLVPLEERIESEITDDITLDYEYNLQYDFSDEDIYKWSFNIRMNKFEEFVQTGANDDRLLLEVMDNCAVIENIFEEVYDDLDFEFDYKGKEVEMNYEHSSLQFTADSTSGIFYYEEYWGNRYLHSNDKEYVVEDQVG